MMKLIQFLWYYIYQAYAIANLFSYFRTFSNILLNAPLSWKTEKCRPKDLRGGAFGIRHGFHQPTLTFLLCFNSVENLIS